MEDLCLVYNYQYNLDIETGRICITGLSFITKYVDVPIMKKDGYN